MLQGFLLVDDTRLEGQDLQYNQVYFSAIKLKHAYLFVR